MFGMLVHSCSVNDGAGQKVLVLDAKGWVLGWGFSESLFILSFFHFQLRCSIDKYVVKDLTYGPGLLASVESHVFKFADRALLDFQCSVSICVRNGGGCDGVTVSLLFLLTVVIRVRHRDISSATDLSKAGKKSHLSEEYDRLAIIRDLKILSRSVGLTRSKACGGRLRWRHKLWT